MFSAAPTKTPQVQYVFFIRHAESRWNQAQEVNDLFSMFRENDHALTEKGRAQCERLRGLLSEARSRMKSRGLRPRWDDEYIKRLLEPEVIYSSPFTRAIQTSLLGLSDVILRRGGLKILRSAREQRNSILSADAAGIAMGGEITARVEEELTHLYNHAETGPSDSIEKLMSMKIDVEGVQDQWWSSAADAEEDIRKRHVEFLAQLRAHGGSPVVVVGHSHFFRRFFKAQLSQAAKKAHPDIAASLQEHVIPSCGVIGLRLEWPPLDKSLFPGSDGALGDEGSCGCVAEAVPLLGTLLQPSTTPNAGISRIMICTSRSIQCSFGCCKDKDDPSGKLIR